jgi:large subunit ribosomal protein L5
MESQMSNLKEKFEREIIPTMMGKFNYTNRNQVPRLLKITLNMGLGEANQNPKLIEAGVIQMTAISGQKPVIRRAKKSVAAFKLREGQPIGVSVTLRRANAFDFLFRMINIAMPRIRDFRGAPVKAFDGRGNYTFGVREQVIFPEVDFDTVEKTKGLNVCISTSAQTDEEGRALLELFGFPFRKN